MSSVEWNTRWPALEPCAVVGRGHVARALARRLLLLSEEELARLSGVAGEELIVILGAAEALPWVDGVLYLGKPAGAPLLLMPTHQMPSVPEELLQAALLARAGGEGTSIAALPESNSWVRIDGAQPLAREALERWLARVRGAGTHEIEDAA